MTDFSTLMSAVKPKDRTNQYMILAAMFALNGNVVPVTAVQISAVFKLHFGSKALKNVSGSLRKYLSVGYVSPTAEGPPRLWSLSIKGIEHLRLLSGLPLVTVATDESFGVDIGIICALESPELEAVRKAFGGRAGWKEVVDARYAHIYWETKAKTIDGKELRVIATTSTAMGLTAAAIVTTQMVLRFSPRLVVMIGIAAGTRSGGKQFGDVLVADPSVDYSSGKYVSENGVRAFQPDAYPLGLKPRLRSVVQKYLNATELFDEIRGRWPDAKPVGANRLHLGPVGAADQVVDDPTKIVEIQVNWRKLIGVEMETYGVYRAVHEAPEPRPLAVSFKAVCDFAAEKSDSWQKYAAFMAAEFAAVFLKKEWTALWPTS